MMKILVVEDSPVDQAFVARSLEAQDIQVSVSSTMKHAAESIQREEYDLVLLDLSLPDGDGLQFLADLTRKIDVDRTPVILLSGNQDVDSRIAAFDLGAEDFLVKPVSPTELRARVQARLRRKQRLSRSGEFVERGPLRIRLSSQTAELTAAGGEPRALELTPKEFKLLLRLATSHGEVVTREELLQTVWGKSVHIGDRTVDTHICSLRKKLSPHSSLIESAPGVGYRFAGNA